MVKPVWDGCLHNHSRADRDRIAAMGVAMFPWSSQARGFFLPSLAKPEVDRDRMNWDWGYRSLVESWYSEDNLKRQARAVELAAKRGVEPINIALAWVLRQKFPCFPLIGPRNIMELQSSLQALEIKLTDAECAWLNLESN
jgi:aryl-alcohol dehydrogenase-like predicted oxidoreductase